MAEKQTSSGKQKLLQISEISLWLDNYDDIFSDFDPRPYSVRSLSDDFLLEAKKAAKDKDPDNIELRLLIPASKRSAEQENTIKKRLHAHFKKHFEAVNKEISDIRKNGIIFVAIGIMVSLGATFVDSLSELWGFVSRLLFILLEPAGWFTIWLGLDNIFQTWKQRKPELDFYSKMSRCEINFVSI